MRRFATRTDSPSSTFLGASSNIATMGATYRLQWLGSMNSEAGLNPYMW